MSRCRRSLSNLILILVLMVFVLTQSVLALEATPGQPLPGLESERYLIANIVKEVTPAVVYITTEWPVPEATNSQGLRNTDRLFRDLLGRDWFFYFGPEAPGQRQRIKRGSGFIISQDGYILTNQHVVGMPGEGQSIRVKIATEDFTGEVEARLLGADQELDLAVLKIDKPEELAKLPVIPLGDSDGSMVGEWVIAIGNPYGEALEHTVTVGVLSAKGREISIYDEEQNLQRRYANLMQTDAAINPGNSGGPLLDLNGRVIGINTAVNLSAQGIGFAIPINAAIAIKDELIEKGKVLRPWLGVSITEVTDELAEAWKLDDKNGVVIVEVFENASAHKAGIKDYEIILKIDDIDITNSQQLVDTIRSYKPGDMVILKLLDPRNGKRIRLVPVTLGEQP